jgi:hypothetical protein
MTRKMLLLSVASFLLSSSFSSGQQSTDQSITDNVLDPSTIVGSYNDCTPGVNCWSGETGGGLPNWGGYTAYWGYGGGILKWTSAINTALEAAGMQIDGYQYQWRVKNKDTNADQGDGDDYMRISVRIYDSAGNEVWGKQYNLDGYYDWSYFNGVEYFDESLKAEDLGNIIIRAEGDDPGYWAGYYGPEFNAADSYVRLIYSEIPNPCNDVPVVDPNCEGFIGEAPSEDPAIKELIIIESTGSIPLSEDELAVLESLEEEEDITEDPIEIVQSENESKEESKVDALSIARNAEANALSDAESTIENTLAATELSLEQDMLQLDNITQQSQQQSQKSTQEAQQTQQQSTQSSFESAGISMDGSVSSSNYLTESQKTNSGDVSVEIQLDIDSFDIAALDNAVNDAIMNLIKLEQNVIREQTEESNQEEELVEPVSNEEEDELVAAALAGSDDEDAQAALLGYNPNFRAYQQDQIADADFYKPKDIYEGQQNYDNPAARFFNGASDSKHNEMVRQQYER